MKGKRFDPTQLVSLVRECIPRFHLLQVGILELDKNIILFTIPKTGMPHLESCLFHIFW
jgi:hypothetical protein